MSLATTHCREVAVLADPVYRCAQTERPDGELSRARARIRNDELLISRQARALAEAASLVRSLESALAREACTQTQPLPPVQATHTTNPASLAQHATQPATIEEHITVLERTVLPTVYTNVGSLLDVFA